jgi:hypothetical protein
MRNLISAVVILIFSFAQIDDASAACVCRCVNGSMQPLCSSSMDLPPICPPTTCGITPPSIAPIQQPKLPPLGTTNCYPAQVQNPRTGQYEWRQVCR